MKIGITGAEGTIGSVLRKGLSNKYKIISLQLLRSELKIFFQKWEKENCPNVDNFCLSNSIMDGKILLKQRWLF